MVIETQIQLLKLNALKSDMSREKETSFFEAFKIIGLSTSWLEISHIDMAL